MKGKLAGLACALAVAATNALAVDLFCQGTAYLPQDQAEAHFPLHLDPATGSVAMSVFGRDETGVLRATDSHFLGHVFDQAGIQHGVSLDRYTGELLITPFGFEAHGGRPEFFGTCQAAAKRF